MPKIPTKIVKFLNQQNWIFAKTYAKTSPHWYIVKNDGNSQMIDEISELIKKEGYNELYQGFTYRCLKIESHKYWITYNNFEDMIPEILNRVPLAF